MRITDKDVERMAALRAEGMSYAKIAKAIGCSEYSVHKKLTPLKKEIDEKNEIKKEQQFQSMMEYLDSRRDRAMSTCDTLLERIDRMVADDDSMIGFKVSLAQLTTAFGTIVDKFSKVQEMTADEESTSGVILMPDATDGDE